MKLYAFGSNGSGQLGIGTTNDNSLPQECPIKELVETPGHPLTVAAGGNHTLVLFESGNLFSAGSNADGRAGLDLSATSSAHFHPLLCHPSLHFQIKFCSALWEASVLVTELDQIFVFGSGSKGELGLGETTSAHEQKLPDFLPNGTSIVDLASGVSHTVIVLSSGEVYGWGNGLKGQLGEPVDIIRTPRRVRAVGFHVVRAVCGREFTYLVGDPSVGRHLILGRDKWHIRSNSPFAVVGWKDIGASWGSIFVLQKDGRIKSWGRNDRGQLAPRDLPNIHRMAVGSEHVLALTGPEVVVCWGWGEHGNCGPDIDEDGDVKHRWSEVSLARSNESPDIKGVAAGCATSFIWT